MRVHLLLALAGAVVLGRAVAADTHAPKPSSKSERAPAQRARSVVVEAVRGDKGTAAERAALRDAIARQLRRRGFNVVDGGRSVSYRVQPTVLTLEVGGAGGGTNVEVKASVVALDRKGRVAAMVEGGARTQGPAPGNASASLQAQAIEAAARSIAEDLARRLLEVR